MQRLASILLVLSACSSSGPGTGAASLSNTSPMVQSAAASSFHGMDASGADVLGWTINFYSGAPGADCTNKNKLPASIGIWTNQPNGSAKKATLTLGDIGIVTTSPPSTSTGAAATMGATGAGQIQGVVTITDFAPDHISGTVSAGGFDANMAPVSLTGMFDAPDCN
jgi:hypothetical protein